ncbi:MAG: gephyrin-like molybdotransferase Glp [Pseudomonadota bacterium]
MSGFDTIVIVDWSGGNDRGAKPKKDAIWAGVHRAGLSQAPVYLRNRDVAERWLSDFFVQERAAGRRVFAGFDFPFGYPAGFAQALTGQADPLALWDWFEAHLEDTPKANNRFALAGEINKQIGAGRGPFWFAPPTAEIEGLPKTKAAYANPFPERRRSEMLAAGAFTCWQMGGAGAVGGQVFTGLPVLNRLRRSHGAAVWPFEPLDQPIAFVEVWPSLTVGAPPGGMIKDAWQVAEVARQIAALPQETLDAILRVAAPEEGWIFGLGHEATLRAPPLRNDCFALPPGVHWTPVEEALELLKIRLSPVAEIEHVSLQESLGRIAATDVFAPRANPPLANAAVDGFGFAGGRAEGLHAITCVAHRAAAGDAPTSVPEGKAIRILTGAALPQGVDTVVLQEDVQVVGDMITFTGPVKAGSNTRKAGEDVSSGDVILGAGRRITPADQALLAATGCAALAARASLRVGVLSTGDELVEVGQSAAPGQIFDANRPMLLSVLRRFGHEGVDLGRAPDDRAALQRMLEAATSDVDAILTSGGASAGQEDHVSAMLQDAGAMALWRVAIKPGRPLALGLWHGVPIFGLPGNPVAALVCTLIFARPALALLAGEGWSVPQGFTVPAGFSKTKKAGRREYLRARIRNERAEVFASEGSGRISGLSWAEGLVELSEPAQEIRLGDPVRYIPYSSFMA